MRKKLLFAAGLLALSTSIWAQDLKLSINEKGKVGYSNTSGELIIKQVYDSGTSFENGYAKVSKGNKFGFIDATGKEVLPLKYEELKEWGNGLYLTTSGKKKGLVRKDGTFVLECKYTQISKLNMYGKAWIAMGAKYGIINSDGKVLVAPVNKGLFEFSRKWDNANSAFGVSTIPTVSQLQMNDTLKTDCKYLIVSDNPNANSYGALINGETGQEIIKKKTYTFIICPKDGMVRYYIWDKKTTTPGYYNLEQNKDIRLKTINSNIDNIKYMTHGDFTNNIAPVNNGRWLFIDKQGNTIASDFNTIENCEFTNTWKVNDGSDAYILDYNGNRPFGDKKYKDIKTPKSKSSKIVYAAYDGNHWCLIDGEGNAMTEAIYDTATNPNYGMTGFGQNGKYSMFNADGTMLCTEADDFLLPTMENPEYLWIKKDKNYYLYDIKNKTYSDKAFRGAYTNFDKGYSLAFPWEVDVKQNTISRIILGKDAGTEMNEKNFTDSLSFFGYAINPKGEICFQHAITSLFIDKAIEAIKANDNKPLTDSQSKQCILEWTKDKRSYKLTETIDEENWDY